MCFQDTVWCSQGFSEQKGVPSLKIFGRALLKSKTLKTKFQSVSNERLKQLLGGRKRYAPTATIDISDVLDNFEQMEDNPKTCLDVDAFERQS